MNAALESAHSGQEHVHRQRAIALYVAGLFLLVLFALLVFSVSAKSPTLDEQNHIARGLAYLKTGDLRLSQEHPPGVNAWEAWPLLLDPGIRLPLDSPSWANAEWYGLADQLLWRVNSHPQAILFAARVPVMWLTLVLAALVFSWAHRSGGPWAGLLALALLVFDPNVLAHGRLTTTDMGLTCLALAAMFALWSAMQRHTIPQPTQSKSNLGPWIAAGVVFGLAQLSKFSALALVLPATLVVALAWLKDAVAHKSLHTAAQAAVWWGTRLALLYGAGFIVVWAAYGFDWGPIGAWSIVSGPAPAYFSGIRTILGRTGGGTTAFLLGQYSETGWWIYFPIAFAIKTPLPTLLLLIIALGRWTMQQIVRLLPGTREPKPATYVDNGIARPPRHLSCLVLPILVFWSIAVSGSFNIGYRHILPSLPFLYILAAWQIAAWAKRFRHSYVPLAICCVLLVVGTLLIFPHYLSFFNWFAGGPHNGYRFLVDSNLDWGQDLPGLVRYVQENDIDRVNLSWFGAAHPEAYGFKFHPLPGFWRFGGDPAAYGLNPYHPAPGIYAISASNLQGIQLADRDTYAWFREQDPVAEIGHSILIYEVPSRQASTQALVLDMPLSQVAEQERSLLEQGAAVRQFDPANGVIVPLVDTVWFVTRDPPGWGEVVRQGPGYVVIGGPFGRDYEPLLKTPCPCDLDTRFGNSVALQFYRVNDLSISQDRILTVEAVWYVVAPPHRDAKSFAHLLDAQGSYVAGWDGITSPATCWQANDRITQRYTMALPQSLAPGTYQIEIGWYDADTLHRWPVTKDGEIAGDRLLLADVAIKP